MINIKLRSCEYNFLSLLVWESSLSASPHQHMICSVSLQSFQRNILDCNILTSWGLPMRAKSSKQRCPALCLRNILGYLIFTSVIYSQMTNWTYCKCSSQCSHFLTNQWVPNFSRYICAPSCKNLLLRCPKFCINPVLKLTESHSSTNLISFLRLCVSYCQKLSAVVLSDC